MRPGCPDGVRCVCGGDPGLGDGRAQAAGDPGAGERAAGCQAGELVPELALPGVGDHLVVVLAGELARCPAPTPQPPWAAASISGRRPAAKDPLRAGDHGRPAWLRLPACRPGKNLDAGQNATRPPPCMRWRGPCFGLAAPKRPVARPPQRCGPPARTRHPCDTPVSRSILTSGRLPSDGARFQR